MDTTVKLFPHIISRPVPPLDSIWATGVCLYKLPGRRGSGVYMLPDRSSWWIQWDRRSHTWQVIDRDTMDD